MTTLEISIFKIYNQVLYMYFSMLVNTSKYAYFFNTLQKIIKSINMFLYVPFTDKDLVHLAIVLECTPVTAFL